MFVVLIFIVLYWFRVLVFWFLFLHYHCHNAYFLILYVTELDDGKSSTGTPIFDGKNHGFWLRFSQNQSIDVNIMGQCTVSLSGGGRV